MSALPVIRRDPSAAVLRMARSWAYAGSRPPETVRDAVLRLGTVPLLNMVLGDYLTRIKTSAPLYDLSEDDLWAHAAAAQLAVRAITQECPRAASGRHVHGGAAP